MPAGGVWRGKGKPEKTLKKDALADNKMNSVSAITYQVTNGKNAMPAFGSRLAETDIEDVANFVLTQSDFIIILIIA